eukprot:Awhi_evm1s12546
MIVDGNTSTFGHSAVDVQDMDPYFEIDLGEDHIVDKIDIINRKETSDTTKYMDRLI